MVCRLIEDKHVAARVRHYRKAQLRTLAAAQYRNRLEYVLTRQQYRPQSLSRLSRCHARKTVCHFIYDSAAHVQYVVLLLKVGYLNIPAPHYIAALVRDNALYQLEYRGLADAVRPDYGGMLTPPDVHVKAVYQRLSALALAHDQRAVYHLNYVLSRLDVVFQLYLRRSGKHQRLVDALYPVQHVLTRFRHLRSGSPRLVADDVILQLLYLLLLSLPLFQLTLRVVLFLHHISGIPALVGGQPPLFYLTYTRTYLVQEVPVVRNYQYRTLVAFEIIFQPHQCREVKMVCRLVQYQQVGAFKQQLRQRQTCLLAARK